MAIPCLCSMAPRGLAPNTRLNNGSMALISVGNTSRSEFIKHLKRYNSTNNQFGFSFIETHSVKAVRLRPSSQSSWTDDVSEETKRAIQKAHPSSPLKERTPGTSTEICWTSRLSSSSEFTLSSSHSSDQTWRRPRRRR
ncbi:ceramide kinase-like protein [Danio aesculapii]|uniref:ceramide kinase-like protein n=1 Tax=Danio aesculapii TaxID=1142201 RepID=UPI0024C02CCB|nr:ceramide kinase-like protein [Danio aesculapii]